VFPVTWIATHYALWATGTALGTVAVLVLLEELAHPENENSTLRLIIVTLSLSFIAISTHTAARQTRAFKRLLRREANKLNETLSRSTRQERELSRVLGSIDVGVVRLSADGDILEVLVSVAGVPELPAQAIAIVAATPLNFIGNKMWSFAIEVSRD